MSSENAAETHDADHPEVGHVVSLGLLFNVFVALLVLTVLTVAAVFVDLGKLNVWIALAIALVKAALVALYFMHLRWDHPFNGLVVLGALLFVAIFLAITIDDTRNYQKNVRTPLSIQQEPVQQ